MEDSLDWLLINPRPKYSVLGDYDPLMVPFAPMGLAYLGASLEKQGFKTAIYDCFISNQLKIEEVLRLYQPSVVGVSCLTPVMGVLPDICRLIRHYAPKTKIILGNIHATLFAKELLQKGIGDIIVQGEAEETVVELAHCLASAGDLSQIHGITYLDGKQVKETPHRALLNDLDQIPLPAWHLLDLNQYKTPPMFSFTKRLLPLLASRGCPFQCYFCAQNIMSPLVRKRNLVFVADEVELIYKKTGVDMFWFADAIFPLRKEDAEIFCSEITRRGLHRKIRWITETRAELIDRPLIKMMKQAGLFMLIFGLESGDQTLLEWIKPGLRLEDGEEAIRAARSERVLTLGLFMLGLPGETIKSMEKTINYAKCSGLDFAKFNIAVPFPGSRFYKDVFRHAPPPLWENFSANFQSQADRHELVYTPLGINSKQLQGWQKKAFYRFYIRPSLIYRHLFHRTISLRNMYRGGMITIKNQLIEWAIK
ncbi:MAG: radical SAM protein [Thermodesulfobacteriota bacterium]